MSVQALRLLDLRADDSAVDADLLRSGLVEPIARLVEQVTDLPALSAALGTLVSGNVFVHADLRVPLARD